MKKIVCSISTLSVGCTFVDWSIHFLAGKQQYYSFAQCKWIPLVFDPLTDSNAHLHDKNHPQGSQQLEQMLAQASYMPDNGLYSMYPFVGHPSFVREKITADLDTVNEKQFNQLEQQWHTDEFSKIFDCCVNHNVKVIFIHENNYTNWYKLFGHQRTKQLVSENDQDELEYRKNSFHKKSIDTWKNLGLENVWDIRERQALDTRLLDLTTSKTSDSCDFSYPHFRASVSDLWHRGVELLQQIMAYLVIPTDPDRLSQWIPIYHEWAQKPLALMAFADSFDDTIQCIVHGWYKELPELSFDQEVMIQHTLIYQHNLNLKTWQLEKFPRNTIDLHQLLEPNIHKLVHTYEELRSAKFY